MTGKTQTEKANIRRAGLPLARAKRLAARSGNVSPKRTTPAMVIGLLAVAGVAGLGLISNETSSAVFASASNVPPVLDDVSEDASVSPEVGAPAEVVEAAVAAPDPVPAAPAPTPAVAAPAPVAPAEEIAMPTCVRRIDSRVEELEGRMPERLGWEAHQEEVTAILQHALDCSDARLSIVGSLELVGSGLADLSISWDRAAWTLDLALVDSDVPFTAAAEDHIVEFVIR